MKRILFRLKKILLNKNVYVYTLSFSVPIFISFLSFFSQNVYPGGINTPLIYDMRGQVLPFYGYMSAHGSGYDNLLHCMSGGLGGNYLGTLAYYILPLDFIYFLIPLSKLPDMIFMMIILRIGLCGLCFSIFLNKSSICKTSRLYIVLFSVCYALMSYNIVYSMVPMWYGCIELLPLLALAMEKMIHGNKSPRFVVLLVLSIICNYYISYMSIISMTLYFIFGLIAENLKVREALKCFGRYVFHGILGAGISLFILIPSIMDLSRGRLADGSVSTSNLMIKNSLKDILSGFAPMSYSTLAANKPPYIFCGSVILIFSIIMFFRKNIDKNIKIAGIVVILVYFCSFIIGPLDRAWHGFHESLGFSCRYSFTYVFFMICFAAKGSSGFSLEHFKISYGIRSTILVFLSIYTVFELYLNSSFLIAKLNVDYVYSTYDEYNRYLDVMGMGIEMSDMNLNGYHRMEKNFNYSSNDGTLFGYDGLQQFSSSYNSRVVDYLGCLGLDSRNNVINEYGLTPAVANLLDIGYYYSYWYDLSDYYEYIDSYKVYNMYRNQNVFPFVYCLNSNSDEIYSFTNNDPFGNINAAYSDICGYEVDVFNPQPYDTYDIKTEEGLSMKQLDIEPEESGHFWFYRPYSYNYNAVSGYMPNELIYLGYYIDGQKIGTYGLNHNRYLADLGYLEAGRKYSFLLDNTYYADDRIDVCLYNNKLCSEICSNVEGFNISESCEKGLVLTGNVSKTVDAVISLPYEEGYRIYVNGDRRDYGSYRNALILLKLNPGDEEIVIKYLPRGLIAGIILSSLFLVLCAIYFNLNRFINWCFIRNYNGMV